MSHQSSSSNSRAASSPLRRRNGALGSCELCRKVKTRCDHSRPACGNCESRAAVCVYQPAPLTRRRHAPAAVKPAPEAAANGAGWFSVLDLSNPSSETRGSSHSSHDRHAHESDFVPSAPTDATTWDVNTNDVMLSKDSSLSSSLLTDRRDQTYYGRTSCRSIFTEPMQPSSGSITGLDNLGVEGADLSSHSGNTELGCWVVSHVEHAATICTLAEAFVQKSQLSPVATLMPVGAIRTFETLQWVFAFSENDLSRTVQAITDNTRRPLNIYPEIRAQDFISSFGGERLRWDFMGLIFAWAGRMTITGLLNANTAVLPEGFTAASFAQRMMECSNACISLMRQVATTSDVLTWCLYENLILLTYQQGESNHAVWQRLGDLSDEIFAMGLHREPQQPHSLPPFLLQARKKVFHSSYAIDKKIATYFGRPPRISARYCNSTLPLDIDDDFFLDGSRTRNINDDPNSWDETGKVYSATWIRARSILGQGAEKILEISLDPSATTAPAAKVEDLMAHCQSIWDSIPNTLRYDRRRWSSLTPIEDRTALSLVVFLEHSQNEFQLRRLWCQSRSELAARDLLLDVSLRILTTAMILPCANTKTEEMHKDQTWILLHHAVPSAGVLAKELRVRHERGEPIPSWTSRSQIVRHTSVLISALEAAASSPSHGNSHLCDNAAKELSRILSDVLDTPVPQMNNDWPSMSPFSMAMLTEPSQDILSTWSGIL